MASEELQDAVIRNVEVIGEAAKRVSAESRLRMVKIDWKSVCGMRDVLIHDYIGADLDELLLRWGKDAAVSIAGHYFHFSSGNPAWTQPCLPSS